MRRESASFEPKPVSRLTAAEQIAGQIRTAFMNGDLAPGERLPAEHELAGEFGVSRATVREAMRILSASHLVASTRGAAGGTFIALPGQDAVAESLKQTLEVWFQAGRTSAAEVDEARGWIERVCVRLAAERRTHEELEAIRAAVEAADHPWVDTDHFLALDIEFHVAISRAAHNAVLELAMTAIHLARPRTNTLLISRLATGPVIEQHHAIYEAIRDRLPDAAERAFQAHFDHLMDVQRRALDDRDAHDIEIGSLTEARPALDVVTERLTSRRRADADRPHGT